MLPFLPIQYKYRWWCVLAIGVVAIISSCLIAEPAREEKAELERNKQQLKLEMSQLKKIISQPMAHLQKIKPLTQLPQIFTLIQQSQLKMESCKFSSAKMLHISVRGSFAHIVSWINKLTDLSVLITDYSYQLTKQHEFIFNADLLLFSGEVHVPAKISAPLSYQPFCKDAYGLALPVNPANLHAAQKFISLDWQDVSLADSIHMLAKMLQIDVILSPAVSGYATLQVNHAPPEYLLDTLLLAHHLAKWEFKHIWFVGPQEEVIKYKQTQEQLAALTTRVLAIHYAKAEDIGKLLQNQQASLLSKRGHIQVDNRTNVILLQDLPARIDTIGKVIQRLDVPVKQVLIEARLVSIDHDCEKELGLHFAVTGPTKTLLPDMGRYSIALAKLADGSLLDVKLTALENAGHARLISSPSLFTANQQSASIEAGEEIPYQEVSESGGTAVVFKKAVLGLKVTPQVLPRNRVLLHMQINQDRPSNKMVQGVPTISTRQVITNAVIKSGQTIVLGGIYETDQENGEQRLPFLSQLPGIGELFKERHTRQTKRELLIFVTPKIIEDKL